MHLLLLTYFLALASAGCNSAAPAASSSAASTTDTANTNTANTNTATKNTITEAQILAIAPGSKSCDGAQYKDECATAKVAAEFISKSFDTYKVTSKAEQAAIIGLMAFETGDFKQNINRNSGLAGQGSKYILYSQLEGKKSSLVCSPQYAIPYFQREICQLSLW